MEVDDVFDEIIVILVDRYLQLRAQAVERGALPPKCAFILRGTPGSGKTTYAACTELYATGRGLVVYQISAHDEDLNESGFRLSRPLLRPDPRTFYQRFRDAIAGAPDVVIVDQCNITVREYQRYLWVAREHHVSYVISFRCESEQDAIWLASRSSYPFDETTILSQFREYQVANSSDACVRDVQTWIEPRRLRQQ